MNSSKITRQPTSTQALQMYRPDAYNLLTLPQVAAVQDDWELAITIMPISVDDKDLVYPTPGHSGQFSLHAQPIAHIAMCAGIQFAITHVDYDPDRNPTATVLGRLQVAPGTWVSASGTYKLDIPARLEEFNLTANAKSEGEQRQKALAELPALKVRTRRFAVQLAETGARSRALRVLLSLKSSYSREDLAKPFVIPRIHFNPQSATMKAALSAYAVNMSNALFGEPVNEPALAAANAILEAAGAIESPPSAQPAEREIRIEDQGE